jgi:hypothetical protein
MSNMENLGETTKLTLAKTNSTSLRTTVPMSIVRQFNLEAGDSLSWRFEVEKGQMIIVVRPIKKLR